MLRNEDAPDSLAQNDGKRTIDTHIGTRIRIRRTMLGMSQERLGSQLGLTFQQVQKYERGITRVGSGRLFQIAKVLEVPLTYFFDEIPAGSEPAESTRRSQARDTGAARNGVDPTERKETFKLVRAYCRIPDPAVRRQIFELTKAIANGRGIS
jgi:transcriptional regulator with XRE-family HTH domain